MNVPRNHLRPSLDSLYDYLDQIGNVVTSTVLSGSAVALTSGTAANVTSITLTPGVWAISGAVGFLPTGTTSITVRNGGYSATSATLDVIGTKFAFATTAVVPGAVGQEFAIPNNIVTVTTNTTYYLVAQSTFTASTLGAYGVLNARLISK